MANLAGHPRHPGPRGDPVTTPDEMRGTFPSHPKYLPLIRAITEEGAALSSIPQHERGQLVLAVTEAWTNVIRHVYDNDPSRRIDFRLAAEPGCLELDIEDFGTYVDPEQIASRPLEDIRPGGLGVHLIKSTMDEVEYRENDHGGTTLHLVKRATLEAQEGEPE